MINRDISEEEARQFVGKNAEYYVNKWVRIRQKQTKISWNWPAFLFGPAWMAYRKMLVHGFAVMVIYILIEHFVALEVDFLLQFFHGMFANYYYLRFARKTVLEARSGSSILEGQLDAMARAGGTSMKLVFVLFLMIIPFGRVTVNDRTYSLLQFLFPR